MKEELVKYATENNLSPFSSEKTIFRQESIFKTRDAKAVHSKVLSRLSSNFIFPQTSALWNFFNFTEDNFEILKRQNFFKENKSIDNSFIKKISKPKNSWKPPYGIIVVTEDEQTFIQLKELGCTCSLLLSERDILDLEKYEIIQAVNCDEFSILLERLSQTIFVEIDEVYLERFLEILSGWKQNFETIKNEKTSDELKILVSEFYPLFNLMEGTEKIISAEQIENAVEKMNEKIFGKIKEMTISGEGLLKILEEGKMPTEIQKIVKEEINASGFSEYLFNFKLPVTIDYEELQEQIKRQSTNEFTEIAAKIKKNSKKLKEISKKIERLSALLLVEDFCGGVSKFIKDTMSYPTVSENIHFSSARNIFLQNPSPINFQLDNFNRCSILTGANSGGKTTLLEHLIQNVSLFQLGLPISGEVHLPFFTEIYYFAKNKGSASKGAFETLLSQMSKIKPGAKTLILADEIEAVTEPGIAGKIISATARYFIEKNCFLIIATHLGHEIQKSLPEKARIDGIEAKGLDENFNLIVDHNPVMGRLAHSTPELIVERMANSFKDEYFLFLQKEIKKN